MGPTNNNKGPNNIRREPNMAAGSQILGAEE